MNLAIPSSVGPEGLKALIQLCCTGSIRYGGASETGQEEGQDALEYSTQVPGET